MRTFERVLVRFTRNYRNYAKDEIAGFSAKQAAILVPRPLPTIPRGMVVPAAVYCDATGAESTLPVAVVIHEKDAGDQLREQEAARREEQIEIMAEAFRRAMARQIPTEKGGEE